MRRSIAPLALLLGLSLLAAACSTEGGGATTGGGGATTGGGGTISLDGQKANDHGTEDVSGGSSVELELDNDGSDYYFSPTVLKGSPGETVKLELSNEGSTEHNFSLSEQGIDQDVEQDESAEVTVTFPQTGTLVFFCKYHASSFNMRGALEVA